MKFPYGISDFRDIVLNQYYYCDRTDRIPALEEAGKYLLFIRPRRFGKSLLLSMLANYYDVAGKDEFKSLFGTLKIGEKPTPLKNRYFILKWDFSCIDTMGSAETIRRALHDHINACVKRFMVRYRRHLRIDIEIDPDNAVNTIFSLATAASETQIPVYLLIDEYDNFANEVLMSVQQDNQKRYQALVYEEGPLRTIFKAVKSSTSESLFDRIFITGVSPVVMSDITSGYNIADNIYLDPVVNDLCGFTQSEVENVIESTAGACGLNETDIADALNMMRAWYNGHRFAVEADGAVYNPTLTLYFLKSFHKFGKYPRKMLDANLVMDAGKLEYIARLPKGGQMLLNLMREDRRLAITELADRFGIREMLTEGGKDNAFMASFLYYFGILTIDGLTGAGDVALSVPNLVIKKLYVEKIQVMLLPEPSDRDDGAMAAKKLYQEGDMAPLCEFVEGRYFNVFHNRDYQWANELTVKTAFLTMLYNDILYIMDSESEIDRRYADLTMIVRPDMRRFTILDILIEFKFVTLKDAGLSGEQARKLTQEALRTLPPMIREMEDGKTQVRDYGKALEKRHGDLRLRKYVVASLGFERIWWEQV